MLKRRVLYTFNVCYAAKFYVVGCYILTRIAVQRCYLQGICRKYTHKKTTYHTIIVTHQIRCQSAQTNLIHYTMNYQICNNVN